MSTAQIVPVLVLVLHKNNTYRLHHLAIPTEETNASIISRIRALSVEKHGHCLTQSAQSMFTMHRLLFGKARVLEIRVTEAQTLPAQYVYRRKRDELMTKLLFDLSAPVPTTASLRAHLVEGVQTEHDGYVQLWCFYYELDGVAAASWLLLALGLATVVGLAIGFGLGDGKLGLSIGTGLLAVLTTIQGAVIMRTTY